MNIDEEVTINEAMSSLAKNMKIARCEKGLTVAELAKFSGVREKTIRAIESGKSTPRIETVVKILVPLGKTIYIGKLEDVLK